MDTGSYGLAIVAPKAEGHAADDDIWDGLGLQITNQPAQRLVYAAFSQKKASDSRNTSSGGGNRATFR